MHLCCNSYAHSPYLTRVHRNPGVRTIEEELLEALCKAEAFPEDMRDNLGKVRNPGCLQAPLCNKRQPLQRPEFH